jgi:hypothetical protein
MSSIWHCFNITTPPPNPTFTPSKSKAGFTIRPHACNVHVIQWPHLHLLHVIIWTHQFSSFIHPCKPLSTFISCLLSNLTSSIVVDYNTINDIYSMICILQNKMCSRKNGVHKSCLRLLFFKMQKDKLHNASHEQQLSQFEPKNDIWNLLNFRCRCISFMAH